jgi:hypothetical protein
VVENDFGANWSQRQVGRRAKSLKTWWPGTELNHRRQPFQGFSLSYLVILRGLAQNTCPILSSLLEPKWSKLYKSEPTEICLKSTAARVARGAPKTQRKMDGPEIAGFQPSAA